MKTNKKEKYNPISAGVSYTIGNMLIKSIPFLTLPIFTQFLSTADFGIYNTYLSYESIISILIGFGLGGTIRVAKVTYPGEKFEQYISSIIGLQFILSTIFSIGIILFFALFYPNKGINFKLLTLLLMNCFCSQIFSIGSAKYAITGEVWQNLSLSLLMTIVNVGVSLFLCQFVFTVQTYLGRIYGTFFAALIAAGIIFVKQLKKCRRCFCVEFWNFGIKMGSPLILHSLSLTLLSQCDKIMIQHMVNDSAVGIYSLSVTLTGIIGVVISSIDNAWAPWFFGNLERKKYLDIKKYNNDMVILFSIISALAVLIAPEIIRIMSSPDYWDSIYSFPPLLMSMLFNFYYLIPVNFEYYNKKTGYIAISTVVTAMINMVLNYILILYIGYIGAAYATCISKFILFLMHWRKAWIIHPIQLVSVKCIILSLLITGALSITTLVFHYSIFIRWCLIIIIVFGTVIYLYKNKYIEKVKVYIKERRKI